MSSRSHRLSIALLGCGGIGSTYAYYLSRAGHTVTAIARPGSTRLAQLTVDAAVVLHTGERATVTPTDRLDEQAAFDLVLVCLQDYQLSAVLPSLQRSRAKAVQLMFNTYRPEQLVEALGGVARCTLGMPFAQASVDSAGKLHCVVNRSSSLLGSQRWVDVFAEAGLPATYEPQMALWLRNHASVCVAFEAVATLAVRRGGGGGATWADAMACARAMQQGLSLTQRLGYPLHGQGKGMFYRSPVAVPALVLWSMSRVKSFRELLSLGETECCAMCDAMIAQADAAQPPIPVHALRTLRQAVQQK